MSVADISSYSSADVVREETIELANKSEGKIERDS